MNRIAIEALSAFGMPPVAFIDLAADLGCANISILPVPILPNPHDYPPFDVLGDPALRREMKAALRDRGVAISLAEGFGVTPEVEAEDRRADLDAVAELGAKQVSLGIRDPDLARAYDQLALLAEMAAERGMTSTTEFAPTLTVKNLPMALEAVRHVGRRDYRLTIDAMHLIRSGSTVADLAALDPDVIGYFQICDVPLVSEFASYGEEARTERMIPGDGELPLLDLLRIVPPDRIVGLEIPLLKAASDGVGPFERLKPAVEATRALLAQLDPVPAPA
jgi:sugar phosphate isomerase/epimerase